MPAIQMHFDLPTEADAPAVVSTADGQFLNLEVHPDAALLLAGFLANVLREPVTVRQGTETVVAEPRPPLPEPFDPFMHLLDHWGRKAARVAR